MKKKTHYILIIITTIFLILGIVFIYQSNTCTLNLYVDNNLYKSIKIKKDRPITDIEKPEKDGYLFMGWYDEENNVFNFENGTKKSINIYARFGKIETNNE